MKQFSVLSQKNFQSVSHSVRHTLNIAEFFHREKLQERSSLCTGTGEVTTKWHFIYFAFKDTFWYLIRDESRFCNNQHWKRSSAIFLISFLLIEVFWIWSEGILGDLLSGSDICALEVVWELRTRRLSREFETFLLVLRVIKRETFSCVFSWCKWVSV